METEKGLFFVYLRERGKAIACLCLFTGIFAGTFLLYHVPWQAAAYPAALCLGLGVLLLLPRFGMKGFLFVILLSSFYTCTANTGRLLSSCGLRLQLWRWLGAPGFAGAVSAGAGLALRHLLADWLTGGVLLQLAAVALGGAGMAVVCFAAAWPLGLGEELRAVAAGEMRHKKNVQKVK